jgi:hypothetical protein
MDSYEFVGMKKKNFLMVHLKKKYFLKEHGNLCKERCIACQQQAAASTAGIAWIQQ